MAATDGGLIQTSAAGDATWSAHEQGRRWSAVASSADGSKLVADAVNNNIHTSTDSGAPWTQVGPVLYWVALAASADGGKLAASDAFGQIYTSSDEGANWTARLGGIIGGYWTALASSADGSKLVASRTQGQNYTSADGGVTWDPRVFSSFWTSVASSADGNRLVATDFNGSVFTSADSGANWIARHLDRFWWSIASSADGKKLIAAVDNAPLYVSQDTPTSVATTTAGAAGSLGGELYSSVTLLYGAAGHGASSTMSVACSPSSRLILKVEALPAGSPGQRHEKQKMTSGLSEARVTLSRMGLRVSGIVAIVAAAGCAAAPPSTPSLAGTSWELVQIQSMDDAQGTTRVGDPSLYTVSFGTDGRATLRLNCNRATGPWQAKAAADGQSGSLGFGMLAGTRALCPPPSLDERLLRDLAYVRGYLLRDGQLHMSVMADGGIYTWRALAAK